MLAKTHLAFGFLTFLLVMPFIKTGNLFVFIGFVLIGALLPDIDQPNSKISNKIPFVPRLISFLSKHRGVFHSIFFAVLIPGLVWFFLSPIYGTALFIGYLSHLIIDGFTKTGINFLHPIASLHLNGFIETGSHAELIVFIGILLLIVIKLL